MRCLFITNRWPDPLSEFRSGTALRMRLMLRGVAQAGFRIEMFCAAGTQQAIEMRCSALAKDFQQRWDVPVESVSAAPSEPPSAQRSGLWADVLVPALDVYSQPVFRGACSEAQAQQLRSTLQRVRPDLVFGHRLASMALLRRAGEFSAPVVHDLDDIETKAFARALAQPPHWRSKPLLHLQRPALAGMQSWAIRAARRTFVCSEGDAAELLDQHTGSGVVCVPNAIPAPAESPLPEHPTVLFLGTYAYEPNLDAANHLVEDIWPMVRAQVPKAKLLIAGSKCELLRGFASPPPGVEYLGFVDDLNHLYARTRVVACPILRGTGTRIKIIEATLAGRPVVSTAIGAEGLVLDPSRNEILHCETNREFVNELVGLLNDYARCVQIGRNGQIVALKEYSEHAAIQRVAYAIEEALRGDCK